MKLLVSVLAADRDGYDEMIEAIQETWGNSPPEGVELLYYYGRRIGFPTPPDGEVWRYGNVLLCGYPETGRNIVKKTGAMFNYVNRECRFDYLLRCCAGSYFNLKKTLEFLQDKPRTGFYCGIQGFYKGTTYASGSGFFLSRDLVAALAIRREAYSRLLIPDDTAVNKILGVKVHPAARRCDLGDKKVTKKSLSHYHFHFRKQPKLMYEIHERLSRVDG